MRMIDPDAIVAERMRQQQVLFAWFSPSFPIGGFAFSHGLEWAHEVEAVAGLAGLTGWLTDLIEHGSARQDAILLAIAWRAAMARDDAALAEAAELAFALQPSRERQMEATVQGAAFLKVVEAAYGGAHPPLEGEGREQRERGGVSSGQTPHPGAGAPILPLKGRVVSAPLTLPVAAAIAGAAHDIALPDLLLAFIAGFIANLCSAAVRIGIVGQTDGQRAIAALQPAVTKLAMAADTLTLDDLGTATMRADLFSMQHETQYSRLFRS